MDAMSDAIEGADVMLYGVSLPYKESANCRMEANVRQEPQRARMFVSNVTDCTGVVLLVCCCTQYAHQQELEMIPLMMQQDFKPTGWRKSQLEPWYFVRAIDCVDVQFCYSQSD